MGEEVYSSETVEGEDMCEDTCDECTVGSLL